MDGKLLLIDGHSMLNRAFYGLPDLTNSEGIHTGAVYGFINILLKTIEEEQPQYLAVAFDVHAPTFRHKMYDAYKGTRKAMPEELKEQVPLIREMLEAMGVRIIMKEGYEADDILGTLASIYGKQGMDVTILSGDRDLLQLATDKVKIRMPKTLKGKTTVEDYHAEQVLEKYQVTPAQIIELKALMGDSSDNIPGLPGVGEKTAVKLIGQFGTVEEAHEHLEEIKPKKAMESMRDHYDMALLSRKLATICTEVPLEFSLEDAGYHDLFTKEAYAICIRLDFKNLLPRFKGEVVTKEPEEEIFSIEDPEGVKSLVSRILSEGNGRAGICVLSDQGEIYGAGFAFGGQDGNREMYFVPVGNSLSGEDLREEILTLSRGCSVCCMDLKALLTFVPVEEDSHPFDCSVAAYLLNPLQADYSYDIVAKEYLDGIRFPSREELFGKKKMEAVFLEKDSGLSRYACFQAMAAFECAGPLTRLLEEEGMRRIYEEIELPLVYTLHSMEQIGIRVQGEELQEYGQKLSVRIGELEQEIYSLAGESFNINSPKQLGVILFEKMGIPGGKKTKTGYSTSADILEKLAGEQPIVSRILEYRQLTKLKSTYADGLSGVIGPDGRIHSTFNQTITATGRISSAEPNLQNIPVRMELGRLIRKVFVPDPGFVFIDADYSQIELRVLAHMSGDENLIEAYREAQDIHRMTASQVFHVPFDEVTPLQRRNAKAVNFGIVYGISSFGLSQDLSISRKEAQEYIENYFRTYPGIKAFLDSMVTEGKQKGYVTTLFGRRRPIPELGSGNFMQRSFGERAAMNSPIQGTAADIIKIAMNRVCRRLKEEGLASRLVLQVHDELLIEAKKEEAEYVAQILQEEMKGAADLKVELEVDLHQGASWYEAK